MAMMEVSKQFLTSFYHLGIDFIKRLIMRNKFKSVKNIFNHWFFNSNTIWNWIAYAETCHTAQVQIY